MRPVRILHYNTFPEWRGGEQQILYLIQGLAQFDVVQFAAGQPSKPFLESVSPFISRGFPLKSQGEFNPFVVKRLVHIIKNFDIDIVHTHSTPAHSLALQAKFVFPLFKLIVHRRVDFKIKNNILSLYKYRSPRVNRIIAISHFIKKVLVEQNIPQEKIEVIYSGIDPRRFHNQNTASAAELKKKYRISDQTTVLGNIAALTGHKDHLTLVRAMKELENRGIEFKLFIFGEGEERPQIEKEIARLNLTNRIELLGFRPDMGVFLELLDVLVHSSIYEGLGTTILDALAKGIPVVATDAGGIPEILGQSRYGLVVPKQNPEAMARAIRRLIKDPVLIKNLRGLGQVRAAEFSVPEMIERTFRVYLNVLGEGDG